MYQDSVVLVAVGQTHTGDLTQSGVRLLGGGGTNRSAHTSLLGRRQVGHAVLQGVQALLHGGSGGLVGLGCAGAPAIVPSARNNKSKNRFMVFLLSWFLKNIF